MMVARTFGGQDIPPKVGRGVEGCFAVCAEVIKDRYLFQRLWSFRKKFLTEKTAFSIAATSGAVLATVEDDLEMQAVP